MKRFTACILQMVDPRCLERQHASELSVDEMSSDEIDGIRPKKIQTDTES